MSAQNLSRKRAAPGAEPVGYGQQVPQQNNNYGSSLGTQLSDDQFLQWGQTGQPANTYQDPALFGGSSQAAYMANGMSNNIAPSNQLARRPVNQLATRANGNVGQWIPEPNPGIAAAVGGGWEDDLEDLEQKAQVAKRDAQAKRKQIPPFVLKLRSFLEEGRNTDLIRWTDDGRSFVVLDEDEFAKKLIPELFKHNNYASFVRQLNMYGFHKKVGLSDNSMRASERKAKSPSEYSNPYFRQGYPDLMWLIQKPKNVTTTKGKGRNKQEGEKDEDGDDVVEEPMHEPRPRLRPQLTLENGENNMTMETLQTVQRELSLIRSQQAQISKMMATLRHEHEKLYEQAANFQDQHSRHEKSINAILTFLATVYRGNLTGQDGAPTIGNIFGGVIPRDVNKGNVVDVGDFNFENMPDMNSNNNAPFKRPRLLLTDGQPRANTLSPASNNSPLPRAQRQSSQVMRPSQSPQTHNIEEVYDHGTPNSGATIPASTSNRANGQLQRDMMSMIQNTNARNASPTTPVADFNNVLNDLENSGGNTPLSNAQRENVLRMINNSANQPDDNAVVNTTPSPGLNNLDRRLGATKADLDALARMQAQQEQSVEKLTNLLQPLSPSGSIPGISDGQHLPPPPMDIDDFLNHSEYFADFPSDGNGNYDFGNNGANADGSNNFNWGDNGADDDDELFGDVDTKNNNEVSNTGQQYFPSTGSANYNYMNNDPNNSNTYGSGIVNNNDDHHAQGRVESVASSEVTTPKHSSIAAEDDGAHLTVGGGANNRSRAQNFKASVSGDEDDQSNKRRKKA